MVVHPVALYLGYVGLAVPFAFAMGALLSGRTDERWIVATRRWTIVAWTALGIGQLLGAHWAYVEVGWGGYYAWDPVENAALMPWLAATAFLHSVMIQEKRGMLRVWNVILVSLAFCLSLFGTFLTRSGVVTSIHSFTKSSIGPWFLGFIIVAVVFAVAMIWLRLPQLRTTTKLESLVSREAAFLYNNLLLVALCLTILWGTAWPMVSEAVRGETMVVGRPYFDFFLRVFGLPLLLLMGIGPLVAWRRASLRGLLKTFAWPASVALATGVILIAFGAGSSIPGLVAYSFSAFVLATIVHEFARGTAARRALTGEPVPTAFGQLIGRNRRRYGGYVVHAAIVLLAIGIVGSSAYDSVTEGRLAKGQSLAVGGYTVTYRSLGEREGPNATEVRAVLEVRDRSSSVAVGRVRSTARSAEALVDTVTTRGSDPQGRDARQPPAAPVRHRHLHHRSERRASPTRVPELDCFVLAMNDGRQQHAYPARVRFEIAESDLGVVPPRRRLPERQRRRRGLACSTSTGSSAARRAAISSRCCASCACRS